MRRRNNRLVSERALVITLGMIALSSLPEDMLAGIGVAKSKLNIDLGLACILDAEPWYMSEDSGPNGMTDIDCRANSSFEGKLFVAMFSPRANPR